MENFKISTVFEFHKVFYIEISNLQFYLLYVCEFGAFLPNFCIYDVTNGFKIWGFLKIDIKNVFYILELIQMEVCKSSTALVADLWICVFGTQMKLTCCYVALFIFRSALAHL